MTAINQSAHVIKRTRVKTNLRVAPSVMCTQRKNFNLDLGYRSRIERFHDIIRTGLVYSYYFIIASIKYITAKLPSPDQVETVNLVIFSKI